MSLFDEATNLGRALRVSLVFTALAGCSGASNEGGSGVGGATNGGASTGGVTNAGSAAVGGSTGGASSTSGIANSGGTLGVGGAMNTGGAVSTGGVVATGGAKATGGAQMGGQAATGGLPATGGATGGVPSTGGSKSTGGTMSIGGASATGGVKATGGMPSTGGSKSTGGASTTGGSSSAGGASATTGCGMTNYPAPCSTSGSPCSMTVDGTTRQYYVKLPSNYNAAQAYPVVFEFHYLGGSAEVIFNDNMYNVRPNFANAIYVIPQGLPDSNGDRGWPNTNNQDIDFTKAMISTLEASYCVDQSRIFSMGFSYGGMMSITIGCLMPEVFRAIGVESGFSIVYNCNPSHEIAVWQTQGDSDTTVTPANAEAARDIFVKLNHCSSTTQAVNPSPCVAYDNCDSGYPVTWCLISGEGHAMWNQSGPAIATFFQQF